MVTVFKSFLRDNLMWLIVYPVICGFSIACFWLFKHFQDELGFTLIHLYGLHPLSIFLISIILAKRNSSGHWLMIFPILMGVGYMAVEYLTFNLANMITFNVMNSPEFLMIFVGAVIAVFGEAVGLLIRKVIEN